MFFFRSGETELYGSLYAAAEPSSPLGLVACGSWGIEADRSEPLLRSVALATAKLGGAGMVFHYPGYGDSPGDPSGVDLDALTASAAEAVAEASRRRPGLDWTLAGFMLGGSVACLAARQAAVGSLLLVQPSLQPGSYFRDLAGRTRPIAPGPSPGEMIEAGADAGMAYGYPVPRLIAEPAARADAAVASALEAFEGEGAVIRHQMPEELDALPAHFERIGVPGAWRFGSQNNPRLAKATADWLALRAERQSA